MFIFIMIANKLIKCGAKLVFGAAIILALCVIFQGEFQVRNAAFTKCQVVSTNNSSTLRIPVPRRIHQLYFGETGPMPQRFQTARDTWTLHHPDWEYTLWNKSMVDDLINVNYPGIRPLYDSYSHWIRRVDVARMLILYHYGGVVVDLDIRAKNRLDSLAMTIPLEKDIVFYKTKPFGVSCDFAMARPKSRFARYLLCGLKDANRDYFLPYLTTMMSTGPLYLSSRLRAYEYTNELHLIQEKQLNKYIGHIDGASWHQTDGKLIWWAYVNIKTIAKVLGVLFLFVVLLWFSCKLYRYFFRRISIRGKPFRS